MHLGQDSNSLTSRDISDHLSSYVFEDTFIYDYCVVEKCEFLRGFFS